ncbi:MAG: hypothetical protein K2I93_01960, partial [Oscillospiraceae bacterium]|nr:hypothetical protein [Oscillospiraceae bacterium]
ELLDMVLGKLRTVCGNELYPAFDAVPLPKKSDRLFTVVALEKVQMDFRIPDGKKGVLPFTAFVKVAVLVPMDAPVCRAETHFYQNVLPVMQECGAVLCEVQAAQVDIKLQRLVLWGTFRMKGLYLTDAEVTA